MSDYQKDNVPNADEPPPPLPPKAQKSALGTATAGTRPSDEPPPFPPGFGPRSVASSAQTSSSQDSYLRAAIEGVASVESRSGSHRESGSQAINQQSCSATNDSCPALAAPLGQLTATVAKVERILLRDGGQTLKPYLDDVSRDIPVWRKAADAGVAEAQWLLGLCYGWGSGVQQDRTEMVLWLRKAADGGNVLAQYVLGDCCCTGQGTFQDPEEGLKWFHKAAEQGYAAAQCKLGFRFYHGQDISRDWGQAVKWWRKAAEQNMASAQWGLGMCHYNGHGILQDREEGLKWIRKAAEQGEPTATAFLQQLRAQKQMQVKSCIIGGLVIIFIIVVVLVPSPRRKPSDGVGSSPTPNNVYRPSYNPGADDDPATARAIQNMRDSATYTPERAANIREFSRGMKERLEQQRREMP